MLGFILSKINLLILVVAIFAILSFFTFGLSDIMKINEAQLILTRVNKIAESLVNSPSYCDSVSYYLPRAIAVSGQDFYYVMKISREKIILENNESINELIFSLFPRRDQTKSIAADSFRTMAEINIFSRNYNGETYEGDSPEFVCNPGQECYAIIDPQARARVDSVVFIKEVVGGKAKLYIIPCESQMCETDKGRVGCLVRGYADIAQCQNEGVGFNC